MICCIPIVANVHLVYHGDNMGIRIYGDFYNLYPDDNWYGWDVGMLGCWDTSNSEGQMSRDFSTIERFLSLHLVSLG